MLFAVLLIWGIFDLRLSLFVPVVNRLKTKEKKVILTFDDSPGVCTNSILSTLEKENIHATFFLIGKNAAEHGALVKKIHESGHSIGIHTQNHSLQFPFRGQTYTKKEIEDCKTFIENITGRETLLFRPPFGITNPVIARITREMKLTVTGWTIRSLDTRINNKSHLIKRILNRLSAGAIILLHDLPHTSDILQELITEIRKKGYGFQEL
jgi:peptidoglycan/xylan/chitin deacetylase (PgdA/CDA1 family)